MKKPLVLGPYKILLVEELRNLSWCITYVKYLLMFRWSFYVDTRKWTSNYKHLYCVFYNFLCSSYLSVSPERKLEKTHMGAKARLVWKKCNILNWLLKVTFARDWVWDWIWLPKPTKSRQYGSWPQDFKPNTLLLQFCLAALAWPLASLATLSII